MEEFLPLLSTDLIVFIFKKCVKRMVREVARARVCVCVCVCVCVRVCPHVSTPELLCLFLLHFVNWNRH